MKFSIFYLSVVCFYQASLRMLNSLSIQETESVTLVQQFAAVMVALIMKYQSKVTQTLLLTVFQQKNLTLAKFPITKVQPKNLS